MLSTATVQTEEQARDAIMLAEKKGLRLAAVSNLGLPAGWKRMTFLPQSAFTDAPETAQDK